jgi:DNA-binding CsgD family transcriptional regulator
MASDSRLDAAAVNAVLSAAGDTGPRVRQRWPADMTEREVDVLRRIALGGTIQEAAADLHLAPKTVDFHLQNISSKGRDHLTGGRNPLRHPERSAASLRLQPGCTWAKKQGELPIQYQRVRPRVSASHQ